MHDKATLRKSLLDLRSAMPAAALRAASEAISRRLLSMPEIVSARTVLAYWPMIERGEVDIRTALRTLAGRGVVVGLPIIRAGDPARRMAFGRFVSEARLSPGPFGTRQPEDTPPIDVAAADVVVVPALGATRNGFRLGYGGGFFDRFLAGSNAFTVVPLFASCLVDFVPMEEHDRSVRAVITESEEIRTGLQT